MTSKRQKRKTAHSQKKSNENDFGDKSLRTTVKNGNNFVNSGKRKMINDCDHKCLKGVGFKYPGVVLHCNCSECDSEKKKRKYDMSRNVFMKLPQWKPSKK